ncbi:orotidine 5'-phosphate decarboxylase [Halobacteriovorax marinus]|uniref:orotidine-5'-phosphate decarboxylase n=1 Tax=Halobacteriovorax marinus TaxID=97084 RepID=UPI000BC2D9E4|nr:orotidine-5'-phosphate decarboxylase [Halobacteriovorax marinus]ATH08098.1 orotidine 5'-phosphate decarboxylase [Halobacteriovorax marinus]
MSILDRVYVALDNLEKEEVYTFLDSSNGRIKAVKIGLELYNKYGREIVESIATKYKVDIFLDLKLHDIPNTVAGAIASLEGLPISFLTIHLSGGLKMIESSSKARDKYLPNCKILGVSLLTSLDENDIEEIWGISDQKNLFSTLFLLAKKGGADGIVCSANELEILHALDLGLESMCPGIRFEDEIAHGNVSDQKRVLTPAHAIEAGADYLVMGRSLTKSKNLAKRLEELSS